MEPTTTTQPTNKKAQAKKSQMLKDTSTGRIIMHLVYRHRVGLLITSNIALLAVLINNSFFA